MKRLLTLLFILSSAVGFSQETFSLEQALEYALNHSMDMANAKVDEDLIEAQKKEVLGIGLPQIQAALDVKNFIEVPTTVIPGEFFGGEQGEFFPVQFGTQWNADAGISASQIIFNGDYVVALQSTDAFLDLTRKNTLRTKIQVAEQVTKAYYNVLINLDRQVLIDANINQLESLLENTKGLYNEGFVEQLEVDRIQVAYNNVLSERDKMKQFTELSKNLLKFQMNYDLNADIVLSDLLDDIELAVFESGQNEYQQRIEWSLLESQHTIAQLAVKKDKYAYLPSLVAYGSYTTQALRSDFNFLDSGEPWFSAVLVGAKLTVPVFSGFQKKYKLEQSNLEVIKLDNSSAQLKKGIELEIKNAQIMLQNNLISLKNQEENVGLAQSIYTTVVKKYEEGLGANIEVIEAETALKTAQNNYYTALFDTIISHVNLKKAKGILIKS